jgi:hypothetical protein
VYLALLKTNLVEALRATFDGNYPEPDFRDLKVSIEYPVDQADYPGIWVQYDDTQELTIAGIGHVEYVERDGAELPVTRWRFGGTLTMTIAALSSLERDRLYDELVRVIGGARFNEAISEFRERIEANDLIATNANFDLMRPSGDNAAPGTPWGTDEMIYEKSLSIDLIGEFLTDPTSMTLVPLRQIRVRGWVAGTPEPPFTGESTTGLDPGLPGSSPRGFEVRYPSGWL